VMHMLCANVGEHNAVVVSQATLAQMCGLSVRSVKRAVAELVKGNWVEVRQIGATSQTNAYIINDRVAWHGSRDGIRRSLFSATIVVSEDEQPDQEELGSQEPLQRLPRIGEMQLPSGDGLPPPSQRFIGGMEPNLPEAGKQVDLEDLLSDT